MKLSEIASALGGELRGDGGLEIADGAPMEDAPRAPSPSPADRGLAARLATTRAAAVLLPPDAPEVALPSVRVAHPYLAFVAAVELLHPPPPRPAPHVDPSAVIAASARLGPGAVVGPRVVIGERTTIGRDAILHPNVTIYHDVAIGDGFTAHAGVVVREGTRIGDRVVLHAGAVIGSDGFGYLPLPDGIRKIPQIGTVVLEDDVSVGANSGVHGDVPAGAVYGGYPASEVRVWRRASAALLRLPEALRRLRRVERALGLGVEPPGEE